MSTRILFVRHGESEGNLSGRFHDSPEVALTEKGRMQAAKAGEEIGKLLSCKMDAIYFSPWRRAVQTCQIAMTKSGIFDWNAVSDLRLHERLFGGIKGKIINYDGINDWHEDAITNQQYEDIWTYDSSVARELGVETLPELRDRAKSFLEEINELYFGGTVIVFSHGGFGRMMQALCQGWPDEGRFSKIPFIKNGEVVEWTYG